MSIGTQNYPWALSSFTITIGTLPAIGTDWCVLRGWKVGEVPSHDRAVRANTDNVLLVGANLDTGNCGTVTHAYVCDSALHVAPKLQKDTQNDCILISHLCSAFSKSRDSSKLL